MSFVPKLRQKAEAAFREREGKEDYVDNEFKDYKGTHNSQSLLTLSNWRHG